MEKTQNPLFRPNKMVAIVIYFLMTLLGGSILISLLATIYNMSHKMGLTSSELLTIISATDISKIKEAHIALYVFTNSLANLLMYLVLFILVGFYMRNYLIDDAKGLVKGYKKLAWLIPVCAAVFYAISYGIEVGLDAIIQKTSVNQSSIVVLINNGGAISMFIAVVICAPIVEELIYRKAIFASLEKYHIAISYVVSILLFTFPHMISTFIEPDFTVGEKLLICIPYMLSGFLLCLTYHLCNKNVYASWFFHMLNNLISFVTILSMRGAL